ncbi:benzodiazapine receptor [Pedobacter sp. UYEF25]
MKYEKKQKFNLAALIINIALTLGVGSLGAWATVGGIKSWYPNLNKPTFNPPNWLFGPVWTMLYILIGISAYLVWQKRSSIAHFPRTIAIYLIQLILNLAWSFIFFYMHEIGFALAEIILLFMMILFNGFYFYRISKWAGFLFIPYLLWVAFASFLTFSIFMLN